MISFQTRESRDYCRSVVAEAKRLGFLASLVKNLRYLAGYSNQPGGYFPKCDGSNTRCVLYKDWSNLSFEFVMETKKAGETEWKRWFNGGLIFHDDHWSVHT